MNQNSCWLCRSWGIVLLLASVAFSQSIKADAILGRWYTEKNEAIFEFYKQNNLFHARLTPLKYPDLRDSLNPVDSLKSRTLDKATLIQGLMYNDGKNCWERGTVYNPSDGRTYSCNCRIVPDGTQMHFRGYIGFSVLGGTRIFSRLSESNSAAETTGK